MRAGAGHRQEQPRAAAEWLTDWARNGLLAQAAFNGFLHMERNGTENIRRVLFAADRSKVELVSPPPELGAPRPAASGAAGPAR